MGRLGAWPTSLRSARSGTRRRSEAVVAPPYDVLDEAARDVLRARDPHNVVHLTLDSSEEEAGRLFRSWLDDGRARPGGRSGCLGRRAGVHRSGRGRSHADGPRRVSRGRAVFEPGRCCRTSARTRDRRRAGCGCCGRRGRSSSRSSCSTTASRRSRFLRASRISRPRAPGSGESPGISLDAIFRRATAADRRRAPPLRDDGGVRGRGRASRERPAPGRARLDLRSGSRDLPDPPPVRLASRHRTTRRWPGRPSRRRSPSSRRSRSRRRSRCSTATAPRGSSGASPESSTSSSSIASDTTGSRTRPTSRTQSLRVDNGAADCAFLLRPTRIEDVFERARRGIVMPQKTTYFFPKLLSGLLFLSLDD